MKTINLKKYYYPICKKDTFVEVPDEVADAIVEESRAEDANDAKQHYHCYSLDASPGMENYFPEQAASPEDILMEKETEREQEAARALMMERLQEGLPAPEGSSAARQRPRKTPSAQGRRRRADWPMPAASAGRP